MRTIQLTTMVLALVAGLFLLPGCGEPEITPSERALKGGWRTNMNDVSLTMIFEDDGVYQGMADSRDSGGMSGVALLSGWMTITDGDGYRVEGDELVLSLEGKTLNMEPLTITSLTQNTMALQKGDGPSFEFKRLKERTAQ